MISNDMARCFDAKYFSHFASDRHDIESLNLWCYDNIGQVGRLWDCKQYSTSLLRSTIVSSVRVYSYYVVYGFVCCEHHVMFNMINGLYEYV